MYHIPKDCPNPNCFPESPEECAFCGKCEEQDFGSFTISPEEVKRCEQIH